MKNALKYLALFLIGGALYYCLEVLFRGYSFWSMVACGGICFIVCGLINERNRCMPLPLQMLIATCGITVIELEAGLILNVGLGLHIWDYSNMPGQLPWADLRRRKAALSPVEVEEVTKLQIIVHLWSIIYDLILHIKACGQKVPDGVQEKIDTAEVACRQYEEE